VEGVPGRSAWGSGRRALGSDFVFRVYGILFLLYRGTWYPCRGRGFSVSRAGCVEVLGFKASKFCRPLSNVSLQRQSRPNSGLGFQVKGHVTF
jgi:hypothetical protein